MKLVTAAFPRVLGLFVLAAAAQASLILDQNNTSSVLEGYFPGDERQQQVTDGIGGVLAGVELFGVICGSSCPPTPYVVSIGLGPGFFTGSYAFTTTAEITDGANFIDTSVADIVLTPGEQFVIDEDIVGAFALENSIAALSTPYAGGRVFGPGGIATGGSMAFQTFIESSSVPEPGTIFLLGTGFLGLFGITWASRAIAAGRARRAGSRGAWVERDSQNRRGEPSTISENSFRAAGNAGL